VSVKGGQGVLKINVVTEESFDEETSEFVATAHTTVTLEHSLVSISKWESLWKKPFLGKKDKTPNETISYIKIMILDEELPPGIFQKLVGSHMEEIQRYIIDDMTATRLYNDPNGGMSRETITSELIYYWMISMRIPVEFQHWHLNRLITLIRVINLKNTPKKKMSLKERRALNHSRLAKYNTRG
jgi:hypothetical protein